MYLIVEKTNSTTIQIVNSITNENKLNCHIYKCEESNSFKENDLALLDWDGNLINSDLRYGKVLSYDEKLNLIHIKNQFGNESANKQYHVNTKIYKLVKQEYLYTKEEVINLINKFHTETDDKTVRANMDWLYSN